MYNSISLDLETLDITPASVVLSIGAAAFNLEDSDSIEDFDDSRTFYEQLKLQPQLDMARTISASTFLWWMNQSKAAQSAISDESQQRNIESALQAFKDFFVSNKATYMLGNGVTFDNMILRSLCTDFEMPYPAKYYNDIDLRTLKVISRIKTKPKFLKGATAHNAKDDAIYQAICAQTYYNISSKK